MKKLTMLLAVLMLCSSAAFSQAKMPGSTTVAVKYFSDKDGAIRGYDPVAYFTLQQAVKGKEEFSYNWSGSTWHFSTKEHKEAFVASPEKYAPQFGGYCAYGVSEDHKSPTDPKAFTIAENKLYLNYSQRVKEMWLPEKEKRIAAALHFWPTLN